MKKIAYILGIICAMTMQSCLDLEPKTQLADTNYWKSPEHFKLLPAVLQLVGRLSMARRQSAR